MPFNQFWSNERGTSPLHEVILCHRRLLLVSICFNFWERHLWITYRLLSGLRSNIEANLGLCLLPFHVLRWKITVKLKLDTLKSCLTHQWSSWITCEVEPIQFSELFLEHFQLILIHGFSPKRWHRCLSVANYRIIIGFHFCFLVAGVIISLRPNRSICLIAHVSSI